MFIVAIMNVYTTISRTYCLTTLIFCFFVVYPQSSYCSDVSVADNTIQVDDGVLLDSEILDSSGSGNFIFLIKKNIFEFFDGIMSSSFVVDDETENTTANNSDDGDNYFFVFIQCLIGLSFLGLNLFIILYTQQLNSPASPQAMWERQRLFWSGVMTCYMRRVQHLALY